MSIFYKFKAAKNYDTISFDGATSGLILSSLKSAILQQKKVKSSDFDLVIENAQTGMLTNTLVFFWYTQNTLTHTFIFLFHLNRHYLSRK